MRGIKDHDLSYYIISLYIHHKTDHHTVKNALENSTPKDEWVRKEDPKQMAGDLEQLEQSHKDPLTFQANIG